MFGKKYIVYTPDTNYGISNNGEYHMNGECSFKFKSIEKANELINYICNNGDGRFSLVEKTLMNQKVLDYKVNKEINDFDEIKREQKLSECFFKSENNKPIFRCKETFISEEFTDMNSYYYMSLALPVVKQTFLHYLFINNYKINNIDLQIVKKVFGWVYELNLDVTLDLRKQNKKSIFDMFNEKLYLEDVGSLYNCDGRYKNNKNFYSYYNIACGLALEEPHKTISTLNFKRVDEFYNNCIAKPWEVI